MMVSFFHVSTPFRSALVAIPAQIKLRQKSGSERREVKLLIVLVLAYEDDY